VETSEFATQFAIEERHFWFVARRRLVRWAIARALREDGRDPADRRLLEVSCATGRNLVEHRPLARTVGVDLSPDALAFCRRRGATVVRADAEHLPIRGESFDLVLALDALEHYDRDDVALTEIRRVLRPGGAAILTVPAFPSLWSPHDEAFHHRRRYRRRPLRLAIEHAGLEIERLTHWSSFLFPPLFVFRKLRGLRLGSSEVPATSDFHTPVAAPIAGAIDLAYRLEALVVRGIDLPIGVSLLAIARRPSSSNVHSLPDRAA